MLKMSLIFVVLVFILFIIFRMTFKIASIFKVLSIAIIVSIILLTIITYVMYLNNIDYELLGSSKKYVTGEVVSKDVKEIKIRVIDHNLDDGIKRNQNITIKITNATAIRLQNKVIFEKSIDFGNIKVGNKVNVICDSTENNKIIAQKIIVK